MALLDDLEDFVDGHGLYKVVQTLSEMCYEKAQHVMEAWGDTGLAEAWEEAGGVLDKCSADIPELP